jgi:predicted  nucleic acid-binding Zn-ribbon protein
MVRSDFSSASGARAAGAMSSYDKLKRDFNNNKKAFAKSQKETEKVKKQMQKLEDECEQKIGKHVSGP